MMPSIKPDTAVIIDTTVARDFRNRGIGATLIGERGKFLLQQGRVNIVSTIAPWNGASLNCNLNKNCARGIRYYRDYSDAGEDRIEVRRNLLWTTTSQPWQNEELIQIPFKNEFLSGKERGILEELINLEGFQVTSVRRSVSSDLGCVLVLQQQMKGGDENEV